MRQNPTPDQWHELLIRQEEREDNALAAGMKRFKDALLKARQKGAETQQGGARKLLQEGLVKVEVALQAWLDEPRPYRPHVAIKWVRLVGADVAAYMTLKVVLDGIGKRQSYGKACRAVSALIRDELRYRRLREEAPGLFEYKLKNFRTSSYAHMARSMDHAVRTAKNQKTDELLDMSDLTMTDHHALLVGAKLIEILVEVTGLVAKGDSTKTDKLRGAGSKKARTMVWLDPTDETVQWLTQRNQELEVLRPVKLPMIVPPLQWAPGRRGGYYFALRGKHPLVRGVRDRNHKKLVGRTSLPLVYTSLNAIQNTAWTINTAVYDLVQQIMQRGGDLAGITRMNPIEEPTRPADIDTNEEARNAWKKRTGEVRDRNHIRKLRGQETLRVIDVARSVIKEEAFYFPYSLDFRGRVYPLTDYLSPQGDDLSKGLMKFAQGKPIDDDSARWLAIHGANCLGETPDGRKVSKLTLDERVQWINDNAMKIVRAADDPFVDTWWAQADEPLQFYAFCVEWAALLRALAKGETYVCALAISIDGTCNGLQHFSAMLRDEVGGAAVNVVPQDRPQDIYQRVADLVLDMLEELGPTDPLAVKWLGLHRLMKIVDRKLTKRPTMTFGYGSKRFGFKKQIIEELRSRDNWFTIKEHFGTKTNVKGKQVSQVNAACGLMAKLIWDSLGDTVVKAFEGMQWFQKSARGIVSEKKAVRWTVPVTGFPVLQEYVKWKRSAVRTMLAGRVMRPRAYTATDELDPIKQSNAVSPNVVHSLDAAALMLTVTQAAADGVEAFAMVHDSYGTLPADCSVLARCCRQSFVRLYSTHDVVELLLQQFLDQYEDKEKCPPPPAKGSLEVNEVLVSDYFFA